MKEHIQEIFSTYGKIKMIDMPMNRVHPHLSKGYAYVEFETPEEAEKALKHMDGGKRMQRNMEREQTGWQLCCLWLYNVVKITDSSVIAMFLWRTYVDVSGHWNTEMFCFSGQIDGQEITVTAVLTPTVRPPPRRLSPPRRMPPPPPMWRRTPPRMRRRWAGRDE